MKHLLYKIVWVFSIIIFISCNTRNVKVKNPETGNKSSTIGHKITAYLENKDLNIGLAFATTLGDSFHLNGHKSYPMMSTFKLPVALSFINYLEKNDIPLHQKFIVSNRDLHKGTYSPFREKYPKEDQEITYSEAIDWMMSLSDNNITDILINKLGGVQIVNEYINDDRIIIIADEKVLNKNWESSILNTSTPIAYVQLLMKFDNEKFISKSNTNFLYQCMINCQTGLNRIKGNLQGVKVANKTGTGGKDKNNVFAAVNDVGIIELPNNEKIYLAIFINKSKYTLSETEKIIADISEIIYEYCLNKIN